MVEKFLSEHCCKFLITQIIPYSLSSSLPSSSPSPSPSRSSSSFLVATFFPLSFASSSLSPSISIFYTPLYLLRQDYIDTCSLRGRKDKSENKIFFNWLLLLYYLFVLERALKLFLDTSVFQSGDTPGCLSLESSRCVDSYWDWHFC